MRVTKVDPGSPARKMRVYKPDGTTYVGEMNEGDTIFEVYDLANKQWMAVENVDQIRAHILKVPTGGEFRFGGRDANGGVYRATVHLD